MIIIVIRLFETSQDGTPSAIVKTLLPAAFHHLHAYLEHSPVGGVTRVLFNAFPISPVLIGLISRVYLLLSSISLFVAASPFIPPVRVLCIDIYHSYLIRTLRYIIPCM
jgi:hypothetical protein